MIDVQLIELSAVFLQSVGILIAERRTAYFLFLATILTIILFFVA